ncbi:MAG TPA: prepilin-type N-terminal cleavage/methylation domain-containing protein [Acidimicrobiales bacterium]|nr:prepilin-type N-terminal cleavage/methylation domain-containing protein [Acidimicrobiales bacterium]
MMETINNRRRAAGEGGFTLIELLVVIVILGILAAVVVFAVSGITDKGQTSACKIDTNTIRTAEEAYLASPAGNGSYVSTTQSLASAGFLSSASTLHEVTANNTTNPPTYVIKTTAAGAGTQKCGGTTAGGGDTVNGSTVF